MPYIGHVSLWLNLRCKGVSVGIGTDEVTVLFSSLISPTLFYINYTTLESSQLDFEKSSASNPTRMSKCSRYCLDFLIDTCQRAVASGHINAQQLLERYDYIAGVVESAFDTAVMEPKITSRERLVAQNSAPYAPRAPVHYEGTPFPKSNCNSNRGDDPGGGGRDNVYLSLCRRDSATSGFCKYVLRDQSPFLVPTSDGSPGRAPVAVSTPDQLTLPDLDYRVLANEPQSRFQGRSNTSSAGSDSEEQILRAPTSILPSKTRKEVSNKHCDTEDRSPPIGGVDTMRKHMTRLYEELLGENTDMVYIGEDVQHGGYYLVTEGLAQSFPLR